MGPELLALRHSGAGGGSTAQDIGKSPTKQRQILCLGGSVGIDKRARMVGENDKHSEFALATKNASRKQGEVSLSDCR